MIMVSIYLVETVSILDYKRYQSVTIEHSMVCSSKKIDQLMLNVERHEDVKNSKRRTKRSFEGLMIISTCCDNFSIMST